MQHTFRILGVPVFVRQLPSGDLSIWHPFNSEVRKIVEPICRKRGYWRVGFNNWIVSAQYSSDVLDELGSEEDAP